MRAAVVAAALSALAATSAGCREMPRLDPCESLTCGPHGHCVIADDGLADCHCDAGYLNDGLWCREEAVSDPCADVDCGDHGRCVVAEGGAAECDCDSGYSAQGLTCVADDPCEGVDCGLHGTCVEGATPGEATCDCDRGWRDEELFCVRDDDAFELFEEIATTGTDVVDILFVVDNSGSMYEEQTLLAEQAVLMVEELLEPTDPDDMPVRDLHIGVVTTDMGAGLGPIRYCEDTEGDAGRLQNAGGEPGCDATYSAEDCAESVCPWLSHSPEHPDDGTDPTNPPIWEDFGCIVQLGILGCGFEQQLEASLAALTTQAEPGGPNEGFLREGSLLAVVYVTDEDDCSAQDPVVFFDTSTETLGPLSSYRCYEHEELLHPISRYHDAFVDLRGGVESLVLVAAIAGIPTDGSWAPGDTIEALRESVVVGLDGMGWLEVQFACTTGTEGAKPPLRIAELVYSFGGEGRDRLYSICEPDWTGALGGITRSIQSHLTGACLPRELRTYDADVCRVVEILRDDRACPNEADIAGPDLERVGWQLDLGLDEEDRRRCEILPADYDNDGCPDGAMGCGILGGLDGWFFEVPDEECRWGRIRFTRTDLTAPGSTVRFECLAE